MALGNRDTCYYCGHKERCTKDHFIPLSKRGYLIVFACRVCQCSKGSMMPLDWIEYLKDHKMINKDSLARVESVVLRLWDKVMNKEIPAHSVTKPVKKSQVKRKRLVKFLEMLDEHSSPEYWRVVNNEVKQKFG